MRIAFSVVLLLLAFAGHADHPPEWLVSRVPAETQILGVKVEGQLGKLLEHFGKPTKVNRDPEFPNEAEYTWDRGDLQIIAFTMFPAESAGSPRENVTGIRVSGDVSIRTVKTGAGIGFGDTLEKLVAKYGSRYQTVHRPDMSRNSATIVVVFEDGTELAAGSSDEGTIISLELRASVE